MAVIDVIGYFHDPEKYLNAVTGRDGFRYKMRIDFKMRLKDITKFRRVYPSSPEQMRKDEEVTDDYLSQILSKETNFEPHLIKNCGFSYYFSIDFDSDIETEEIEINFPKDNEPQKVKLEIECVYCSECPFHELKQVYTADSFEDVSKLYCKKSNRDIYGSLDWNEIGKKDLIPSDCPIRK